MHAIDLLAKQGEASAELVRIFEEGINRVLSLLKLATGASSSLLVRILVVVGPSVAWTAEDVLAATLREADPRMKYRAFQFALATQSALLQDLPWSTFAPIDAQERSKWERAAFDP